MNVIPQYKVIGPSNSDRIIHDVKKNYAKREDSSDKRKDAFDFEDTQFFVIR